MQRYSPALLFTTAPHYRHIEDNYKGDPHVIKSFLRAVKFYVMNGCPVVSLPVASLTLEQCLYLLIGLV